MRVQKLTIKFCEEFIKDQKDQLIKKIKIQDLGMQKL